MNITILAKMFADAAHSSSGQKRKYSGDPYIVHPIEVADIVQHVDHDENMIAAAYLHDVVEDTNISIHLIKYYFGDDVANLVDDLTDVSKPEDGNRSQRKTLDRNHTSQASARAQTIKLADLIANTKDITNADKSFAKVYMNEKRLMLEEALTKGDPILQEIAWKLVRDWEKENYVQ